MWAKFNNGIGAHSQLPTGSAAPNHSEIALPVVTFEAFLEHYFTMKLNALPKVLENCEIRIANITFGFNNQ